LQKKVLDDPSLELSKVNISKHKLMNKHFTESGILRNRNFIERLLKMETETRKLITKLDEIQKGKLV